jgi:hypothetical protein
MRVTDLNQIALDLVATASVTSLILLVLKGLGKEFESVVLLWIRVLKRIQAEINNKT